MCLFVCVVGHGVNEGEPVDEQYCEPVNEDQFRDSEPEGQDLPEGYEEIGRASCRERVSNCV